MLDKPKIVALKDFITEAQNKDAIELIKNYPEVLDEKDEQGTTGFLLSAYSQNKDLFETARKYKKSFSVYESIIAGKLESLETFLEADKSLIDKFSPDGFTLIALAAFFNQNEIVKYLLQMGADPSICSNNPMKVNALHAAVAQNNLPICQMLITHGIDVNISQMKNITPLQASVHRGNIEITKLLLEQDAYVTFKNDDGSNAIDIAEAEGHYTILDLLNTFK